MSLSWLISLSLLCLLSNSTPNVLPYDSNSNLDILSKSKSDEGDSTFEAISSSDKEKEKLFHKYTSIIEDQQRKISNLEIYLFLNLEIQSMSEFFNKALPL